MKYKLIKKLPFENSPEIGHTIDTGSIGRVVFKGMILNPKMHPEYWEPVVEKTYEVLEYTCRFTGAVYAKNLSHKDMFVRKVDLCNFPGAILKPVSDITRVRRLSDNQLFSVGDEVKMVNIGIHKITGFLPTASGDIHIMFVLPTGMEMGYSIGGVEKPKKLITEDGVEICDGTFAYFLKYDTEEEKNCVKYFASKKELKKYVILHVPREVLYNALEALDDALPVIVNEKK